MSNHRLTFLALNVTDLELSTNFYRDILGVPVARSSHDSELDDPWYGGEHAALSWSEGAFLHFALYPSRIPERPVTRSAQVGFHVDDIDTIHKKLKNAGSIVLEAPRDEPWGRTARYLDPDENIVSITQGER
jgi:predicted enzyme related to lactoylglutathione lyase